MRFIPKCKILLLLGMGMLTSCATVFSGKEYQMPVCANQPNSSLKIYDTVYQLPAKIKVKHSIKDLPIVLQTDSFQKEFILKASPSPMTIFGNLPYVYVWPIPYYIDHHTEKRYYYGKSLRLDVNDTTKVINRGFLPVFAHQVYDYFQDPYPGNKGQINVVLGGPFQNHLYLDNTFLKEDYNFFGGAGVGLEYFYTDKSYLKLGVNHVRKLVLRGWKENEYTEPSSTSIELTNNYGHKRFTFGYGVNYSINQLKHGVLDSITEAPLSNCRTTNYRTKTFGLSLSSHVRIFKQMYFGVNYRPNFIQVKPESDFKYEHNIGIELLVKLRVKK